MSLKGLTVAVTASRRAKELAYMIKQLGGKTFLAPTVGIEANQPGTVEELKFVREVIKKDTDYVVFMTGPGVYRIMSAAKELGLAKEFCKALQTKTIVSRSPKPKKALIDHKVRTHLVPEENTAEGIAKLLTSRDMKGKKVVVLWHGSYSPILKDQLESVSSKVFESSVYSYSIDLKESGAEILSDMGFDFLPPVEKKIIKLIQNMSIGGIDVITFTSPPSVRNLFSVARTNQLRDSLDESLRKVLVVAIGPPTRKTLEGYGVNVGVMPNVYKMGPMLKALESYLEDMQTKALISKDGGLSR